MPNGVPMAWMSHFYEHPPVVVDSGRGATFTDIDGNSYLDFNLADTSMFTGYGLHPLTEAVAARTAAGPQFLLPTEDGVEVAAELLDGGRPSHALGGADRRGLRAPRRSGHGWPTASRRSPPRACGIQATEADVARYLEALDAFLREATSD
jgi:hypothetical protein